MCSLTSWCRWGWWVRSTSTVAVATIYVRIHLVSPNMSILVSSIEHRSSMVNVSVLSDWNKRRFIAQVVLYFVMQFITVTVRSSVKFRFRLCLRSRIRLSQISVQLQNLRHASVIALRQVSARNVMMSLWGIRVTISHSSVQWWQISIHTTCTWKRKMMTTILMMNPFVLLPGWTHVWTMVAVALNRWVSPRRYWYRVFSIITILTRTQRMVSPARMLWVRWWCVVTVQHCFYSWWTVSIHVIVTTVSIHWLSWCVVKGCTFSWSRVTRSWTTRLLTAVTWTSMSMDRHIHRPFFRAVTV